MHIRTEIRQLIRDRLVAAGLVSGRVYAVRHRPLREDSVPCILVYPIIDEVGKYDMAVAPRDRTLTIAVVPVVNAVSGGESTVDDDLDELCEDIETVMEGDGISTFGIYTSEFVHGVTFSRTELRKSDEGSMTVLSALMFYEIQYRGQV